MISLTFYNIMLIILFVICFVAFVFFTRGRRPISSILAWLFFIFIFPFVGIPLFLILGQRKLNWLIHKKRSMVQTPKRLTATENPTERLFNSFGMMSMTQQNSVRLLADGIAAYQCLIEHIKTAKKHILISVYLLGNDIVGKSVVELLIAKAQQGVHVRLLLDTVGSYLKFPRRKLKPLRKAGGHVRYMMPLFHTPFRGQVNLRDHRKIFIFDGHVAMMGGMNLANEYMGPEPYAPRWTDICLEIKGDAVKDLIAVFESDWAFAASNQETNSHPRPQHVQHRLGTAVLQTVASGPDTRGDPLYDAILHAIFSANKEIYIVTPYFVLDDTLQKAFMIAVRRGVKVNIILPHHSNHPITDLVRGLSIRKLHAAGAHIWLYPKMIHAKAYVFDNQLAIVGSANFDIRSLLLNFEISCFMYSEAEITMMSKWCQSLIPLCSKTLEKPSVLRMLAEDVVQLIKPLS